MLAVLLAVGLFFQASGPVRGCATGHYPEFNAGFLQLASELSLSPSRAGPMGGPITCEYPDPKGTGDVLQETTGGGLAFWRKSTNTPTWTNGAEHYALTAAGLVTWAGPSIDPPPLGQGSFPGRGQGDLTTLRYACDQGSFTEEFCSMVP